jgi:hypothetical protein
MTVPHLLFTVALTVSPADELPVVEAQFTKTPVTVDGKLDDAIWKNAKVYSLVLGKDRVKKGQRLAEAGKMRVAWDDKHLYIGVEWTDSDIVAKGKADHEMHFRLGDLCEVFLRHEDQERYWELYVTSAQKKSCFWLKRRGGRLQTDADFGMRVAAHVNGTLNQSDDTDRSWSAELAIPAKDLTAHGAPFGTTSNWRLLVARYNYNKGRSWKDPELSMTPQLTRTKYHRIHEHARLRLLKPKQE